MITPELIGYIRGEFAKGRVREEIRQGLLREGGWSEADLSEAFKIIIPMQGFAESSLGQKAKSSLFSSWWKDLVFIVIGLICVVCWYFYRPQIVSFWNSSVNRLQSFSTSSFNFLSSNFEKIFYNNKAPNNNLVENNKLPQNNPVIKKIEVKDCGISTVPDLKKPLTYQNDAVLTCLGNSALLCEDAKAVLKDALFPSLFEIVKNQETCNFKLSYPEDSALMDATGKKLALQYVSCPLSTVKAVDESKKVPSFNIPSTDNLSKYTSQIYFYGTLGLFIENNLDQNKIQSLGCSGSYIDSVIASYRKIQSKR